MKEGTQIGRGCWNCDLMGLQMDFSIKIACRICIFLNAQFAIPYWDERAINVDYQFDHVFLKAISIKFTYKLKYSFANLKID